MINGENEKSGKNEKNEKKQKKQIANNIFPKKKRKKNKITGRNTNTVINFCSENNNIKWGLDWDCINGYQSNPIIISPNLGIPAFFPYLGKSSNNTTPLKYNLELNVVAPEDMNEQNIKDHLSGHLFIKPLFEIIKNDKIKKKLLEKEIENQNRLRRGLPIELNIVKIEKSKGLHLKEYHLPELYGLKKEHPNYALKHNFFGKHKQFFRVIAYFSIEKEVEIHNWLETHTFIMFDLIQTFSSESIQELSARRICYHSIVINKKLTIMNNSRKSRNDRLRFVHISDLHIAKRWDELLGMLASITITKRALQSLKSRYRNPNNHLRRFINWVNSRKGSSTPDFIIMSGDIIDYYLKNKYQKMKYYELEESNWDHFLHIVLNFPVQLRSDVIPMDIWNSEEISIPIFTIPGNHDVRVNGYPLHAQGIYSHFGLTKIEAIRYKDPFKRYQRLFLIDQT